MSYIYEVLVDTSVERSDFVNTVADVLDTEIHPIPNRSNRFTLDLADPVVAGDAYYVDEGGDLDFSRYNFTVLAWDRSTASDIYDRLKAATDWNIALFDEEQYQITNRREAVPASA